jgi:hypothetical protein
MFYQILLFIAESSNPIIVALDFFDQQHNFRRQNHFEKYPKVKKLDIVLYLFHPWLSPNVWIYYCHIHIKLSYLSSASCLLTLYQLFLKTIVKEGNVTE